MKGRRRLGVRAMRQNLRVYLRRVEAGETLEVTARGKPVAVLAPIQRGVTPIERLVASGRASLARVQVARAVKRARSPKVWSSA